MRIKAEKILKEENIIFSKTGGIFYFYDTRQMEEPRVQKYVKKIFIQEGINFNFWVKSIESAPQTDEELTEYLKNFLIKKEAVNISEVREEVHIGESKAIRLMNRLVKAGLALSRKEKRGGKWKINEKYENIYSDYLFLEARRLIVLEKFKSTAMLQQKLKIGFQRASRLMDMLKETGVVKKDKDNSPKWILKGWYATEKAKRKFGSNPNI